MGGRCDWGGIPAGAGMGLLGWIPACAGMTVENAGMTVEDAGMTPVLSFRRRPESRVDVMASILRRVPAVVG